MPPSKHVWRGGRVNAFFISPLVATLELTGEPISWFISGPPALRTDNFAGVWQVLLCFRFHLYGTEKY